MTIKELKDLISSIPDDFIFEIEVEMTIKELKDLISSIPDDFIFEIEVEKEVPKDELIKRAYPYPIDSQRWQVHFI